MNKSPLSRRQFVQLTALTSLAGTMASGCDLDAGNGVKGDSENLTLKRARTYAVLEEKHLVILETLAFALLPIDKGYPDLNEANLLSRIDEQLYFSSNRVQEDSKLALSAINYVPFIYGYFSRFQDLSIEDRKKCFEELQHSRFDSLRVASMATRALVHFSYFSHKSTWDKMGYDGPFGKLPEKPSEQHRHYLSITGG